MFTILFFEYSDLKNWLKVIKSITENLSENCLEFYSDRASTASKICLEIENNDLVLSREDFEKYKKRLLTGIGRAFEHFSLWIAREYTINKPSDVAELCQKLLVEKYENFSKSECGILLMTALYEIRLNAEEKFKDIS